MRGSVYLAGDVQRLGPDRHSRSSRATTDCGGRASNSSRASYEYKFVVDGTWIEDPGNPDTVG